MSFRGYYQVVCRSGHYTEVDCYEFSHRSWRCATCQSPQIKAELIDQTNGEGQRQDPELLVKKALAENKPS